jgi:hypothetical protein
VIPPMVMWVRFRWFAIWVPLFLFYPIVLALWLMLLPFVILGMAVTGRISRFWKVLQLTWATYEMVCALRGLRIDVRSDRTTFQIQLI